MVSRLSWWMRGCSVECRKLIAISALPNCRAQLVLAMGACLIIAYSQDLRSAEPSGATSAVNAQFFQLQVKPILDRHCMRCHGPLGNPKGGLRLTSRENVLLGGESGAAVNLEKPVESLLVEAI